MSHCNFQLNPYRVSIRGNKGTPLLAALSSVYKFLALSKKVAFFKSPALRKEVGLLL